MPNPFLTRIEQPELPDTMQDAWDNSMQLRGDATFFEVFGHHPDLYHWYMESFYGQVFYAGKVDRKIKELLRYRLSTVHGCRFCNQGNRKDALAAGIPEEQITGIDDYQHGPFSPGEKAVLKLADQMVLTNETGGMDQSLYDELHEYFDDAEILEIGLVMGILCGVAKFLFVFDLVEKEEYCPFNPESG